MDEKLKATIQKIRLLATQNPEFESEMKKIFGSKEVCTPANLQDEERIKRIEKYLGLDYYVDDMQPVIDYSFVKDVAVRAQLVSDCREMMRFRYGTRFHEILFEEFCRYAQLQAEMLLNYFYSKKNNYDFEKIKVHLLNYNPTIKINEKVNSISGIDFNNKIWSFVNEFNSKQIIDIFNNIRQIRNQSSHRTPIYDSFSMEDYKDYLLNLNIPLKPNGELFWGKIMKDKDTQDIVNKIKNEDDYKKYVFYLWYNNKPYDSIIEGVKSLKNIVAQQI